MLGHTRCVVSARLDVANALGCAAVVLVDDDSADAHHAILVVRPNRIDHHHELVLWAGTQAKPMPGPKYKRAHVQTAACHIDVTTMTV